MTHRKLVVVTAGLSQPSSTRLLADQLSTAATRALAGRRVEKDIHVVELREHAQALANNLLTGFPAEDLRKATERVQGSDGLIVVSPIFNASYSGLFKMFFDVLERGSLTGKPVLMAATGGSARHSLALEHAMRPMFAYLAAMTVPTAGVRGERGLGRRRWDRHSGAARRASGRRAGSSDGPHRADWSRRPVRGRSELRAAPGWLSSAQPTRHQRRQSSGCLASRNDRTTMMAGRVSKIAAAPRSSRKSSTIAEPMHTAMKIEAASLPCFAASISAFTSRSARAEASTVCASTMRSSRSGSSGNSEAYARMVSASGIELVRGRWTSWAVTRWVTSSRISASAMPCSFPGG